MAHAEPKPWTLDDFLAWERTQPERYEFVDGAIRMMVGGTNDHRTIALNIAAGLRERLRGAGCRAFVEGPKVVADGQSMYPDVAVVRGAIDPKADFVADAVLIAEVLSRSTAGFDAGAKWQAYRELPSLQHYLLVSQDACAVDLYTRDGEGWRLMRYARSDQVLPLTALGIEMPLAEVYEDSSAAR